MPSLTEVSGDGVWKNSRIENVLCLITDKRLYVFGWGDLGSDERVLI